MNKTENGFVTLVGAGCSRGQITLRGLQEIRKADVIVYDALIDEEILFEAKSGCECIDAGKRCGKHSMKQEDISALLVQKAQEGKRVVRLKGGDCLVFGRGGEEALCLRENGIPYEMVPGVTSPVAVTEHFGIPLTHRSISRSFSVITGHGADGLPGGFRKYAKTEGTLVFLMGLGAAERIARELQEGGMSAEIPAAILSRGFSPAEACIRCTLGTLAQEAENAEAPAILVVGETAGYDLRSPLLPLLGGARIAVTGTPSFTERMRAALADRGADVLTLRTMIPQTDADTVPQSFEGYGWLVFTSANGIDAFFNVLAERKTDCRCFAHMKFACIGKGTAERLMSHGFRADLIPGNYTAEDLGKALAAQVQPAERVLILRAEGGSPLLTKALEESRIPYEDRKLYASVPADIPAGLLERLSGMDYVVFGSAGGVRAFFEKAELPAAAQPVCIGQPTADVLLQKCGRHGLTAAEHSVSAIAELITEDWAERNARKGNA